MKLSLNDPVWSRLYGPYGVRNVPGILESLKTRWDDDLARELFWEELHHQDDVYPVTYAALPWLLDIVQRLPSMPREALCFFSLVLRCAVAPHGTGCDGKGPRGKYRGLALEVSDHAHSWVPADRRLTENDMIILKKLETWFDEAAPCIAEICLSAIGPADDGDSVALVGGAIALDGGENVAWAAEMWADGLALPDIVAQSGATSGEAGIALKFADRLGSQNPNLSGFLRKLADELETGT